MHLDFRQRFRRLLGSCFRNLSFSLAMRFVFSMKNTFYSYVVFIFDANPLQLLIGFLKITASVLASKINFTDYELGLPEDTTGGSKQGDLLTPYDRKRLEAYTNNLVDFHMVGSQFTFIFIFCCTWIFLGNELCKFFNCCTIFVYLSEQILDLVPLLAHRYFQEKMPVTLNGVQAAILLCMGLQNKDLTSIKVC